MLSLLTDWWRAPVARLVARTVVHIGRKGNAGFHAVVPCRIGIYCHD